MTPASVTLTQAQRRAVERTGQDVCVVAGPGSGKTRVLIERFAWLVEHQSVDPTRILAVTFTEKAATEIKQRLVVRLSGRTGLREAIERAWVSTIHGFCARLLRENAVAAGLAPEFAQLDEAAALLLQREAAEQALEALYAERPAEFRRLLEALDLSTQDGGRQPDLARALIWTYDAMRSLAPAFGPVRPLADHYPRLAARAHDLRRHASLSEWARRFLALPREPVSIEHLRVLADFEVDLSRGRRDAAYVAAKEIKQELLARVESQFLAEYHADLRGILDAALGRFDAVYRRRKREAQALDFADLEECAIRLLEADAGIRRETRERFDQILMDELQDTNPLQWRLIDLLRSPGRFFAVGDINQSIYGFRHAEPRVFDEYRRGLVEAGALIDELRENHRSRQEILDAVERVLHGQPGIEPRRLIAARGASGAASVERMVGDASLVAARIHELVASRRYAFRDIAILVRALTSVEDIVRALDAQHIPYLVTGGRTFLEAREIRDLVHLLAVLVNERDEMALTGVLRSPLVGVSDESILRRKLGLSAADEQDRARLERFGRWLARLRPIADFVSPDRLLAEAIDESDYLAGLSDRARGNIEKLFAWLRRCHRVTPQPLAAVIESLEALRSAQAEAEAPPAEAGNVVRLMSIHAAKGLEFPVVFVAAIHRGPDRRPPVLCYAPGLGLGARWRNPVTGEGASDLIHAAYVHELKEREQAEENRLLYVAMTRAEDRLVFQYEQRRNASAWQKLVEPAAAAVTPGESRAAATTEPRPPDILLARPAVTDQYDSHAAVTSVALFHACPRRYYLSDYLGCSPGLQSGPRSLVPALDLGLQVHALLAGQRLDDPASEALELAARFERTELARRAARATRIEREFDFLLDMDDIVLAGQIDLWFEEGGELVLVDYKTDRDESEMAAYELQLGLYALALEHYAGRLPDRAVIHFLRSDHAVEVDLSPACLQSVRATVREFRGAEDTLRFPLNVGEHCARCSFYRNLCPSPGV